ncbi:MULTISPECIES: acetyl/propionyl/methylcrotonyl-CoA carboxylase subunit alpha [Rhodanobacter]|uniref:acetyl/propionyl/methylcrotonyl-CoA carboxylase subunit alpha n=1 Tax=Rhodanobacter TaxID=75309 RepID=UPI00042405A5|nr:MULTISPECIES: acetyl/propionyl/methylcrotonyl-CoA carboxylase subunit alpha [Rhodanobacter]TAN17881.1 MAG: acetyl/propionyl/methylcrotonyl-CoA carboxylase subunit alpha [Rhodanobacter sp.]UJJ56243.1 acetyl/propionyl/methylcrotonyl-CoA carboxylase subunit alpha [Rhodanobacter thiooxydans]
MFERVLIANRGEIACRVIRTCRRLGIRTIAVYSEADKDAQHVRLADEAWPIGGPLPTESYLRIDAILDAAKNSGAQAIHPGYGFLSENTAFSRACRDAGIVFIGPDPESIEAMGSKAAAKHLMAKHAVPLVPGYDGDEQDNAYLAEQAHAIGYPLIIKPSAGGGGKGMQIVRSDAEFAEALATAQRVALAAFGDASMLLERYVEQPRHIEFQVFGDRHGHVIHLNERECSAQRRYQKVLEETPSPFLDDTRRQAMGAAAVAAAKAVDYVGAGTVEFIVAQDGTFFFMEMNTRLQVEHPVTELTLGLDLVEWQLRVANGEALPLTQDEVASHGHAIEVRIYAEDPDQNFLPGSGKLHTLRLPAPSAHVRLDGGVVEGDTVTIFYDPMIAKLIVFDADRPQALQRLREALAACEITGPKSNIGFLERLARHPAVVEGRIDTGYLDRHLDEFLVGDAAPTAGVLFAAATAVLLRDESHLATAASDPHSPWASADAWRISHAGKRIVALTWREQRFEIEARGHAGDYQLRHGETGCSVRGARLLDDHLSARFDGESRRVPLRADAAHVLLHDAHGQRYSFARAAAFAWASSDDAGGNQVIAPMPGRIVLVKAKAGDTVEQGQELLVMEAMKMELALKAPRAGTIESVNATQGEFVEADAVLVRFADRAS